MQVSVNLTCDQIARLVYNELVDSRDMLMEDMDMDNPNVFSLNEVYDKMQIQKHIDALNIVIDYYKV